MRRVLSIVAFALLFIKTAIAADLPLKAAPYNPPSFSWTGLYLGASGGYGAGQLEGGLGTFTVGINLQSDLFQSNLPLVYSIEADITAADLTKNSSCAGIECSFRSRWIETTRGRVGYMIDKTLLFATGGFAVSNINGTGPLGSSNSEKFGYAVGGGIEYSLTSNWSLRADYLHIDFGNVSCNTCDATPLLFHASSDEFRVGIVFRFFEEQVTTLFSAKGPPIEPPPFER